MDLAARVRYYRPRWPYMSIVGVLAEDLILRRHLRTALELGPHLRPVLSGADVMELKASDALEAAGRVIIHDATEVPWPIDDRAYDLFVGLQVFEHLHGRQVEAFREVRRIARHAIISLPIDWEMEDTTDIHHMLSNETALSWFQPLTPTRIELGNGGAKKRFVYVFEDMPA